VRGTGAAPTGGRNEIAVFRINEATGEPSLIQNIDTRGFTPRTFALEPSGRSLVVGNQNSVSSREWINEAGARESRGVPRWE
jgi:6-phosphogluconolactonase (cycloisomerase 2 family)